MSLASEIKKTAIQRSLLEVDLLIGEASEMAALGHFDETVAIDRQLLVNLEERYRGEINKIPVDVLVRRYRILNQMSGAFAEGGFIEPAIQAAIEANSLAVGPLSDFPELFIQSSILLGDCYIRTGDRSEAKNVIMKAVKAPKGDDVEFAQALAAFGTGKLFVALDQPDLAARALAKGDSLIRDPEDRDLILLKGEILRTQGDAYRKANNVSGAEERFKASIKFLYEKGRSLVERNRSLDAVLVFSLAREICRSAGLGVDTVLFTGIQLELAEQLDLRGRWEEANRVYQKVIENINSSESKYQRGLALALAGMGNYRIHMKKYDEAESELLRANEHARKIDDAYCLSKVSYYLGLTYSKKGLDEKGVRFFEEALDIAGDLDAERENVTLEARICNQLGFVEAKDKRFESAIGYFQRAIDLVRDYPTDVALGETYRLLGDIHCERGQNMQSERALKKALAIYERAGASFEVARVYKSIGTNLLATGDLDKANFFFNETINMLEKLGIESDLPMAYSYKARICIMREEFKQAEELFTKDFNIAKKADNRHSLAYSYYHLGCIRRLLNRTHSAEDFLKRSLDLFSEVNNVTMAAMVMLELAMCTSERKDFKSATDFAAKAQEIFDKKGRNTAEIAYVLKVRAVILCRAKRWQMSKRCFEDCLRIHEKLNQVTLELAEAHYEFALFWKERNDKKEATNHLISSVELAEKLGLEKKRSNYLALLNQINPEAGAKIRLSQFMDKAAVEQISKGKPGEGLTVERRNITVLFTDIRSFTTISESLELGELTSFLNDFYNSVTQVVMKFQGQVNKFIGDAVMAIFNIDGSLEDHTEMAVRAAVDLVRTISEVNLIRKKRGEIEINVGIGVNTGEALLGSFGSSVRTDYTAIGDNVNIASRLQTQAGPGEIVVSEVVHDIVSEMVTAEDMGEKPLKGKGQPLRLWKIKDLIE
ncbi:MAG TPA: tetratricopeptide repeat protein [bacterium]|nr:tetratricopeptide repeat protein [bacterium]